MPIVNVSVPPQLAAAIQAAIDDGSHASESEVVREALQLWNATRHGPQDRNEKKAREQSSRREWFDSERLCVADLFAAHLSRAASAV